jgi:hypothetical protein
VVTAGENAVVPSGNSGLITENDRSVKHFLSGAVAQLGERLICIQEVAGSIPTSSTSLAAAGRSRKVRLIAETVGAVDYRSSGL